VIFRQILQQTLNFNCNFLEEGKRYLTFPVDFLKAHDCFPQQLQPFFSNLIAFKSLQNDEGYGN
jgi:hypothetical protein